jgi:hypothetical protein
LRPEKHGWRSRKSGVEQLQRGEAGREAAIGRVVLRGGPCQNSHSLSLTLPWGLKRSSEKRKSQILLLRNYVGGPVPIGGSADGGIQFEAICRVCVVRVRVLVRVRVRDEGSVCVCAGGGTSTGRAVCVLCPVCSMCSRR